MAVKAKPKSAAFEAIHSAASDLYSMRQIDAMTMRQFDDACLTKVPFYTAKDVQRIRNRFKVSQTVFARYLNTSTSTVQKWEVGDNVPSGLAAKMLYVVEKLGLGALD
jgi:putative transcriptional regulator